MQKFATFWIGLLFAGLLLTPIAFAKAPAVQTTAGVFLGIEQGDYAHWKMRNTDGEEVSYFILKPDASVEAVLANPQKFLGKKCQVSWVATTENLPEAGGRMEVEHVVSVAWVK